MRNLVVIAMIAAAAGLAGCGKSDTKVYSNGKDSVAVSQSGDHMTITGSNGEKVEIGSGASASAKMPSYLPLYPGAKVTSSFTGSGKDGIGGMVAFQRQSHAGRHHHVLQAKGDGGRHGADDEHGNGCDHDLRRHEREDQADRSVSATKGGDGTTCSSPGPENSGRFSGTGLTGSPSFFFSFGCLLGFCSVAATGGGV